MPTGVYVHEKKAYPPETVERVRELYMQRQWSQQEIADDLGVTRRVVGRIIRNHDIPLRPKPVSRPRSGPDNHMWRGSQARYTALHHRVWRARGKADHCVTCGANDPAETYHWANLTGDYADVDDYAPMCVSCHKKYDNARRDQQHEPDMAT